MVILFFGDVFGKIGRKALVQVLPKLKKKYKADFTIANGENLAHGSSMTPSTLKELLEGGVDVVTGGNHTWEKPEVKDLFANQEIPIVRPYNYPPGTPGKGFRVVHNGQKSLVVLNFQGRVFMRELCDCPFRGLNQALEELNKAKLSEIPSLVDFHGEATSEKVAFGWHAAGRVSAVVGSHTQVQTGDERILEGGTAYITDAGMSGVKDGVIGLERGPIIEQYLTGLPKHASIPEKGTAMVEGVAITINEKTARATAIERIRETVEVA